METTGSIPLEQEVGSVANIESLSVTDVFGEMAEDDRADKPDPRVNGRWTLFTCSRGGTDVLPSLVLPPTVGTTLGYGTPVEAKSASSATRWRTWCGRSSARLPALPVSSWSGYERATVLAGPSAGPGSRVAPLHHPVGGGETDLLLVPVSPSTRCAEKLRWSARAMADPLNPGNAVAPVGRILQPSAQEPLSRA